MTFDNTETILPVSTVSIPDRTDEENIDIPIDNDDISDEEFKQLVGNQKPSEKSKSKNEKSK